jgi:tight adherence protein B
LILLSVILPIVVATAAFAILVKTIAAPDKSVRVNRRMAALDHEFAPAHDEDALADIRRQRQTLSAIPWINGWLARMNLATACSLYLYQAGMTQSIGTLLLSSVAGMAGATILLYLRFGAILPALLLSCAFIPAPYLYVRIKRARRLARLEQQIPEALGLMVSALRVGHSLIASLGAVGQECAEPIAGEVRKCFEEQNYGVDLRTSLFSLIQRAPVQDFRIFAAAVLIQKDSGGNLAEVLDKVVQTTRERTRLRNQVSVHTAQGRMTGWVLSLLPLLLGVGMYVADPDGIGILWNRPVGVRLLYAAAGMDVAGALIIRKIVGVRI